MDVRKTVTDAGYIAIGLGVMGYQQTQIRRRELTTKLGAVPAKFGSVPGRFEERGREVQGFLAEGSRQIGARGLRPGAAPRSRSARRCHACRSWAAKSPSASSPWSSRCRRSSVSFPSASCR